MVQWYCCHIDRATQRNYISIRASIPLANFDEENYLTFVV